MKHHVFRLLVVCLFIIGCGGGGGPTPGVAQDGDQDGIPDIADPAPSESAADIDTDDDGVADIADQDADLDGDGIPNVEDTDADGDDTADVVELNDFIGGTYDMTSTVTETDCRDDVVGKSRTEILTLGLSEDGQSLTATTSESEGSHPFTGWLLGNDFYLNRTEMETVDFPEGSCLFVGKVSITGTVEADTFTASFVSERSVEPADCAPDFSACRTVSSVQGKRR